MSLNDVALACVGAVSITATYVGLLYLVPRRIRSLPRDEPSHIAWRMLAVAAGCVIAPLVTYVVSNLLVDNDKQNLRARMGIDYGRWDMWSLAGPIVAIVVLYAGSIFVSLSLGDGMALVTRGKPLVLMRNLIVSPIAEEWTFRCCVLPLFQAAGLSHLWAVTATAATFSSAHLHHLVELLRRGWSLTDAIGALALQCTYTGLFGALAAHVLAVTKCAPAVVAMHAFCNYMGLPDVSFMAPASPLYRLRWLLIAVYVAGIAGSVALFTRLN